MRSLLSVRSPWVLKRAELFGASEYLDCPVCAREAAGVYCALGTLGPVDLDKPIQALFPSGWLWQEEGSVRRFFLQMWMEQLLGARLAQRKWKAKEVLLRSARQIIAARARTYGGCTCPRT